MRRARKRSMIPMTGKPGASATGSPTTVQRLWTRTTSNAAVSVPVVTAVIALVLGVVLAATRDGTTGATRRATAQTTVPRAGQGTVVKGSGQLNDILVSSIVQIVLMKDGQDCSAGSGSVIGDPLHVLTNHHVIAGDRNCPADRISVRTSSSASASAVETYVGKVISASDANDIAILALTPTKGEAPPLVPLHVVSTDEIGQEITVVGYPAIGGDSATVSRGILSGFAAVDGVQWIKTDALVSGGNSGGAALDAKGRLLGVPTMYSQSTSGQVVDCRNAVDTNGDGRVDGRDQCVSLGGTIGLVAPAQAFVKLAKSVGLMIVVES